MWYTFLLFVRVFVLTPCCIVGLYVRVLCLFVGMFVCISALTPCLCWFVCLHFCFDTLLVCWFFLYLLWYLVCVLVCLSIYWHLDGLLFCLSICFGTLFVCWFVCLSVLVPCLFVGLFVFLFWHLVSEVCYSFSKATSCFPIVLDWGYHGGRDDSIVYVKMMIVVIIMISLAIEIIISNDDEDDEWNGDDEKSWHKQQTPNPAAQGAALAPPWKIAINIIMEKSFVTFNIFSILTQITPFILAKVKMITRACCHHTIFSKTLVWVFFCCLLMYFGGCFARFLESVLRLGRLKCHFLARENGHFCQKFFTRFTL